MKTAIDCNYAGVAGREISNKHQLLPVFTTGLVMYDCYACDFRKLIYLVLVMSVLYVLFMGKKSVVAASGSA